MVSLRSSWQSRNAASRLTTDHEEAWATAQCSARCLSPVQLSAVRLSAVRLSPVREAALWLTL